MSFQLQWSIEGEKQLSRRFQGITAHIKDLSKPFDKSAKSLQKIFSEDVFNTQGSAIQEKWRPLSPVTIAQKARKGYGSQALVATGKMKDSFRYKANKDSAVIWNDSEYFKYHQSNKPRRKIPRRIMMKLAEQQRQLVVKVFHEYLRKVV